MCCLKNFKNKFVGRLTTWRYKCTTSDVRLTNFYSTKNSSLYPLVHKRKSILRCFCSMHYRFKKVFIWNRINDMIMKTNDHKCQTGYLKKKKEFQKYIMSSIFCQLFFTSWEPLAGICIPNWKLTAAITESIYYHITITNSNWWRKDFWGKKAKKEKCWFNARFNQVCNLFYKFYTIWTLASFILSSMTFSSFLVL